MKIETEENETMFNNLANRIIAWLKKNYPNGYDIESYDNDTMEIETLNRILSKAHPESGYTPKDAFYEWLWNAYEWTECDTYQDIYNEVQQGLKLTSEEEQYMDDNDENFMEIIKDNLDMNYPEEQYLNQEVNCNIIVDNGDANYDFDKHDCYPFYNSEGEHRNLSRKSGMMLIAHLQGYSTKKFRKIYNLYKKADIAENKEKQKQLKRKYPFVTSCYEEIEGTVSSMQAFVLCVKVTIGDLLDWYEKKTDIKITKNVDTSGLYDTWNGGGSYLEVKLEKDMVIPKENIFRFAPDDAWNHREDGLYFGYSISDCYGMDDSAWKEIPKIKTT